MKRACASGDGFFHPEEKRAAFGRVGSYHSILDGLGEVEEEEMMMMGDEGAAAAMGFSLPSGDKKRRLSMEQVKALEKNFEVENKLEPERKVKLAQELGLQPRQVAVWFQNRRARWKTKQLERDYDVLKANFDALKATHDRLALDKDSLLAEIKELKGKLSGDGGAMKEEPTILPEQTISPSGREEEEEEEIPPPLIYKDGLSDSDSSAILNDFSSSASPSRIFSQQNNPMLDDFTGFQYHDGRGGQNARLGYQFYYQQQQQQQMMMKMEETEFEPCGGSFFSDEQPPSFPWY